MTGPDRLRAITFLAPGIPLEFFELVSDHLARQLSCEIELVSENRNSGPMHGDADPFAEGRADIGFLCSPSYLYLRALSRPSIELVPASFAFRDARAGGRPVYFSEVVVRADHPAQGFTDLAGGVWGFNDECSLSGYFAALQKLSELGCENGFFGRRVQTGSHQASIEAALAGEIDGAAIDSTVLAMMRRERPELTERLRVLESWGPFPIQPVVVRSELASSLGPRIADALLGLHRTGQAEQLSDFGLERCVPIEDRAYAEERRALYDLGLISSETP
jgi:phosphonate transport system substrate-binding protein